MTQFDLHLERYPNHPGWKKRDTSKEAAASIKSSVKEIHNTIMNRLNSPMTADEMAFDLGMDPLYIRPRFSELSKKNRIKDSGDRHKTRFGKNAIAWVRT